MRRDFPASDRQNTGGGNRRGGWSRRSAAGGRTRSGSMSSRSTAPWVKWTACCDRPGRRSSVSPPIDSSCWWGDEDGRCGSCVRTTASCRWPRPTLREACSQPQKRRSSPRPNGSSRKSDCRRVGGGGSCARSSPNGCAARSIQAGWLIRVPSGGSFRSQLMAAGARREAILLVLAHAAQYACCDPRVVAARTGGTDRSPGRAWLTAWTLALFTLVPMQLAALWLQGRLAIDAGCAAEAAAPRRCVPARAGRDPSRGRRPAARTRHRSGSRRVAGDRRRVRALTRSARAGARRRCARARRAPARRAAGLMVRPSAPCLAGCTTAAADGSAGASASRTI